MNAREACFCEEYLKCRSARQAALAAGYAPSMARSAARWLNAQDKRFKPEVWRRVNGAEASGVTKERVIEEYARIAFASIADIRVVREQLDDADNAAAIASVKLKSGANTTDCDVRMYDKMKALDMLSRHLGLFAGEADGGGAVPEGMPRIVAYPDGSVALEDGEGEDA